MVSQGSFPCFLQRTTPAPSLMASAEDITNPRLSIPTILSIPLSLYNSYISSLISLMDFGFLNRVVTSLKFTPSMGQFGMQRKFSNNKDLFISIYVLLVLL